MAASAVVNIVTLGIGGLLSVPALVNFFSTPLPNKINVNIGIGATNSSAPLPGGQDLKGNAPRVTLYDINGAEIGTGTSNAIVTDGGTVAITIAGKEGTTFSETPQYIQLEAFGDDPVCVSWLNTVSSASDGADFRSWNGATAQLCNVPWYPSVAPMPGVTALSQPPCFWLNNSGEFVVGMSARLVDFFFPGTETAQSDSTGIQWQTYTDTLCDAPGRQQFYKTLGACIPFYPSGLTIVNQKDPDTGFDVDFDAIKSSHTHTCSIAGVPFNNVDLGAGKPDPELDTIQSILSTAVLQSNLVLGPLGRRAGAINTAAQEPATVSTSAPPAVTEPAKLPEKKVKTRTLKEPVLGRRVEKRNEEPHRWCQEKHLVISEYSGHSAINLCESESSWGPDFVAVAEGIFCDMCNRQTYPLCGSYSDHGNNTVNASNSTGSAGPISAGAGLKTCFNTETKQLRVPAKLRRSIAVPVKDYQVVKHWK